MINRQWVDTIVTCEPAKNEIAIIVRKLKME